MPITFADPVHGRITLPDFVRPVLESPVLARLRNVRQLGFTLASYPGAVHTRYEHTLGTASTLDRLLAAFEVNDSASRDLFLTAALLSEIGIYPLSYSSRSLFKRYGLDKAEYARKLYDAYLALELKLTPAEDAFVFSRGERMPKWFFPISQYEEFAYLDPVSLASTIDYVLRDSYYTGRYVGGFDHRYFLTIETSVRKSLIVDMREALRSLHRAVHAMNATYGDPRRRLLSRVLHVLVEHLINEGLFDVSKWKAEAYYVELDDDEFLYQIQAAVSKASAAGNKLFSAMYDVVTQRTIPRVERVEEGEKVLSHADLQHCIAQRLKVEPDRLLVLGDTAGSEIGFRLFGTDYHSYAEALSSPDYSRRTGLIRDSHQSGQETGDEVFAVVLS